MNEWTSLIKDQSDHQLFMTKYFPINAAATSTGWVVGECLMSN